MRVAPMKLREAISSTRDRLRHVQLHRSSLRRWGRVGDARPRWFACAREHVRAHREVAVLSGVAGPHAGCGLLSHIS